jgi:hypothetical protein
MDEKDNEMMAYLEEQGALIWDGMNKDGEAMFKFDLPKLKTVMPQLYDQIMLEIDDDLMELYQAGMVEIEYDENLNALFKISEKGAALMENFDPDTFFNS